MHTLCLAQMFGSTNEPLCMGGVDDTHLSELQYLLVWLVHFTVNLSAVTLVWIDLVPDSCKVAKL